MIKDLKAHLISHCEASTLVPYREYLEKHGWTFYFNDSQDFCRLARLGVEGSIRQIGGPNEESQESFFEWSKFAIFEVVWWKAIVRKTFALSSTGYFSRHEDQEYEVMTHMFACHTSVRIPCGQRWSRKGSRNHWRVPSTHDVKCVEHQITLIGGDANKMGFQKQRQQLDASYGMSAFQFWMFCNFSRCLLWTCGMFVGFLKEKLMRNLTFERRPWMLEIVVLWRVWTFHAKGWSEGHFLWRRSWNRIWNMLAMWMRLYFWQTKLFCSRNVAVTHIAQPWSQLSHQICRGKSEDHFWLMTQGSDKRKAEQKARKAKGKAKASNWSILFIIEDNFSWLKLSTLQRML